MGFISVSRAFASGGCNADSNHFLAPILWYIMGHAVYMLSCLWKNITGEKTMINKLLNVWRPIADELIKTNFDSCSAVEGIKKMFYLTTVNTLLFSYNLYDIGHMVKRERKPAAATT